MFFLAVAIGGPRYYAQKRRHDPEIGDKSLQIGRVGKILNYAHLMLMIRRPL